MNIHQEIMSLHTEVGTLLQSISKEALYLLNNRWISAPHFSEKIRDILKQIEIKQAKIENLQATEKKLEADAEAAKQAIKEENAGRLRELIVQEMSDLAEAATVAVQHGCAFEMVENFNRVLGSSQLRRMFAVLKKGDYRRIQKEIEAKVYKETLDEEASSTKIVGVSRH